MQVQPYLFFDGRAEEALEFYKVRLGATVSMLMRFKECPEQPSADNADAARPPGNPEKIMHATFSIGDATIMASDGNCGGKPDFKGFALSIGAKDDAEAERLFAALSEGGQVQMPMGPTFFASRFGMVADKFGVGWMVISAPK